MKLNKTLLVLSSFVLLTSCGGSATINISIETSTPAGTSQGTSAQETSSAQGTSSAQETSTAQESSTAVETSSPEDTSAPVGTSSKEDSSTTDVTSSSKEDTSTPVETSEVTDTSEDPEGEYYTITFDSKGGSEVAPIRVKFGEHASKPTDPTKANATFLGWFKDEICVTPFNFETHVVTADWTLYAGWHEEYVESSSSSEAPVGDVVYTLQPGIWDKDNARFAIYLFNGTKDEWASMSKSGNNYVVTLSSTQLSTYTKVIFCRMNGSTTENNWNNKWNQSPDEDMKKVSATYVVDDWSSGHWAN